MIGDEEKNNLDNSNNNGTVLPRPALPAAEIHPGMVDMKKEQFDESVNRALYQASRNLELNETLRYLEKDVNETERRAFKKDSVGTRSGNWTAAYSSHTNTR